MPTANTWITLQVAELLLQRDSIRPPTDQQRDQDEIGASIGIVQRSI